MSVPAERSANVRVERSANVPARLLSLRLQGFKSFAARTTVEFGDGISAIVGPNGAGKSNLADALRWALGEQGRALRSRRSEDVIFAGSEAKPALGMADVTIVIENSDGLLPVEYGVVELGRRLFRSGEGEYLLNGTRVRLRDLEDLLEAARLADNAFLFIGQGMVDQALALRPEERRPLFEEVAGVRRHERRKRAAQARLLESEANLARVRDIIAELRPQARRLAAQAEQQAARSAAADALAQAIVSAGRWRWHEAASRLREATRVRERAQGEVDGAIAELRAADDDALALTEGLERRLADARLAREALEEARAGLQAAQVEGARLAAEREALAREAARLEAEREATERRIVGARRRLALPLPPAPGESGAEAALPERAVEEGAAAEAAACRNLEDAVAALGSAASAAEGAERRAADARRAAATIVGQRRAAEDRLAAARAAVARLAQRAEALDERLRGFGDGSAPPGAERLAEALETDVRLRKAVEAALGAAARGAVVESAAAGELAAAGTPLVLRDVPGRPVAHGEGAASVAEAVEGGGGRLVEAVRADPTGVARRILERAVWVPDLAAAVSLAATLPPGWVVATVYGDAVDSVGIVVPASPSSLLELHAEHSRAAAELAAAETAVREAESNAASLDSQLTQARSAAEAADRTAAARQAERRAKVEAEAAAARVHELAAREAAWWHARQERLTGEAARPGRAAAGGTAPGRRAGEGAAAQAAHGRAVEERQRLEGFLAADLERAAAIGRQRADLAGAEAAAGAEAERHGALSAELSARVVEREAALRVLDVDEGTVRDRLVAAERAGRAARERLRLAESRARSAEVGELEARMALDTAREQLLVELAGLGEIGWRALAAPPEGPAEDVGDDAAATFLETALDAVTSAWSVSPGTADGPSRERLAALRRRYHELGAVNPFAAEEHAEIRARLAALESQRDDLDRAIAATRRLIADLQRAISERFQATFRALESAFDRRFTQLFGGGHARLDLTDPGDPAASGVEIIARPPGKKAQPLSMLSGGERALTAVSLLFAMLEVRPVPFCVLDEVDAALDEANIGRFAEALRELARGIQFVVITHNRGTIEEADALYGVTIGDDAVSRVVSLRLDGRAGPREATALAVEPRS